MKYIIVLVSVYLLIVNCPEQRCIEFSKVKEIGGCDKHGDCGVVYDNGEYGKERFPVIGKSSCTEYRSIKTSWRLIP